MVKKGYQIVAISILVVAFMVLASGDLLAQCPMCKMAAESNMREGGTNGKGLNAGILFILSLPYVIVGSIGYAWWRNNREFEADFMKPTEPSSAAGVEEQ